jgi:hypothetical protein
MLSLNRDHEKRTKTSLGHLGKDELIQRPQGVTLNIVSATSENLIRFSFGPLAASITAGNVVILALSLPKDHSFVSCLESGWRKYLDPDSIFFVPSFEPTEVNPESLDQISIFGMLFTKFLFLFFLRGQKQ